MMTRLCSFIQSPDANEGALAPSKYSTERSPTTALLFEAKRNVALPVVQIEGEDEDEEEKLRKAERSFQDQ